MTAIETPAPDNRRLHTQVMNLMACIVTVWGQMLTQSTFFPQVRHKLALQAQIFAAIGILVHATIWRRSSGTERVVIAIMFAVNLWTISRAAF